MRLTDALKQKRADILDRAQALSEKAADENRLFHADEATAFDAAMAEVKSLDEQIDRQMAADNLLRGAEGQRRAIDDQGHEHLILRAADKLSDRHPRRDGVQLNIAKALRGIVSGDWAGADFEKRAMGEGALASGGYAVSSALASQWLDMARAKAVCIAAGAGTLPMVTQQLRIAEIVGDVAPAFRPENTALPENDVTFGAVDLRARLVGVVARSSLELIADSPMASDMIVTSITAALGLAMDQAMLSGNGTVDATHDNPRGILGAPGVPTNPVGAALDDYDALLDAMHQIEVANLTPTSVVMHPNEKNGLRKLVTGLTGDKTKLAQPADVAALQQLATTGIASGNMIVGNFLEGALFGLREGIVIEATRVGADALSKAQVLIRGYMRLDVGLIRKAAFCTLTGVGAP
ncbi:MAG: phage major capsid protein [Proteobacteria bacterium]|nr:phage major capsid protein [Pseudomonadota bacterium]